MNLRKYAYYLRSVPTLLLGMKPPLQVAAVFLGLGGTGPHRVQMRDSGLRFKARSAMDLWSLKETLLDRFYERYGTAVQPGWTVVDVGGGLGDYALFAAHTQPTCRVVTFEPTPGSFALLQENVAINAVHNIRAEATAIWSSSGEVSLDVSGGEAVQFTSRAAGGAAAGAGGKANGGAAEVRAPSLSLEDAFRRHAIECCNLLKMDCEGAEYPILFNATPATLAKIERIVMEYHDNAGPHTHADMERYLSERGFSVRSVPSPVHAYLGYLYAERGAKDA